MRSYTHTGWSYYDVDRAPRYGDIAVREQLNLHAANIL